MLNTNKRFSIYIFICFYKLLKKQQQKNVLLNEYFTPKLKIFTKNYTYYKNQLTLIIIIIILLILIKRNNKSNGNSTMGQFNYVVVNVKRLKNRMFLLTINGIFFGPKSYFSSFS